MNPLLFLTIVLIGLYIAFFITSPLLSIFHELGHAIAYLTLTNSNRVDIYIGSYGNPNSKLNFSLGRLHFHITPALFIKGGGLCKSDKIVDNYIHWIIILLAGSFFSIILSCFLGYFIFNTELHGAIKFYFFCLIICSFISLFFDLAPRTIKAYNLYNDGKLILFTYRIRKVFADYALARKHLLKGENLEAIIILKTIIAKFPYQEIPIRQLIPILIVEKQLDEAKVYLTNLENFTEFTIDDYIHMGYFQTLSNQTYEAQTSFNKALVLNKNNPIVLNNLGHVLIVLENYEEAQQYLEKAIKLQPELAEPYNNLGQVKLLRNQLEEAKALIEKSISLNPKNAHAYKNLGLFYSKVGDMELAKFNFDKAEELDGSIEIEQLK
ncbi:tetratricopeptide repeat protein [Pedobacter foliorum]|uniref:tetratricopeptide repeat protein n=1 Tax=Pedobacter foliorum TaxID=2739058 RepID=UPI001564DFCD|nr:tetratricopeptide repeat protein [Pedobacter foliorum]NRF37620.1 tetratricopeptide repeat protein [Pedobacter foliorum]